MYIKFWGTRGSIATPGPDTVKFGGNTACVEIVSNTGKRVVIDAGTGIRALGDELVQTGQPVHLTLLLTHTHWDHILGMAFFKPVYMETTVLNIDGCPKAFWGLANIFDDRKGNGFFPVAFDELKARIRHLEKIPYNSLHLGDLTIDGIETNHPQGGMGFKIRENGRCLVFLTDNELAADAPLGRQPEDFALFAQGCDLLIHDAQYLPEEIEAHRGWGHSSFADAVNLAIMAKIPQLILFHHDPGRTDREIKEIEVRARKLIKAKKGSLKVSAAREGETILL
jgi:phosphoribosyl 1,2-cyclic phosphodiesterase